MPKFMRIFYCKKCGASATLEEVVKGSTVVECEKCKVKEYWGDGALINAPMKHFTFRDERMMEA